KPDEAHDVLEQATDEGMMHGHGSGRSFQFRGDLRVYDKAREETAQIRILHLRDGCAEARVQLFDVKLRVWKEVRKLVVAFACGDHGIQSEFLLAVIKAHAAANLHHVVAFKGTHDGGEVLPHFRGNGAGAIGKLKLQPGRAGAQRRANLFFSDEEEG